MILSVTILLLAGFWPLNTIDFVFCTDTVKPYYAIILFYVQLSVGYLLCWVRYFTKCYNTRLLVVIVMHALQKQHAPLTHEIKVMIHACGMFSQGHFVWCAVGITAIPRF
jgi:hypothetical protein